MNETCAHCKVAGEVGKEIFPYSISKGVTAWLHSACERAYYWAWKAANAPESLL